ncbi:MAG TPA: TonB-dependent receptor [Methylotenera sp.]|nr:TonB-dependent receptor [Methylotenera sp.]
MKKSTIASLVGLVFTSPAFAVENINLDEVVVTASRFEEHLSTTLRDVSVIDHEQIERAGQSTLVEILQTQPGIEITNTGGEGKASGIFMRGTSSNHVLVLIDGVRVNSATLGTTTFENIPVALIDKIEIVRGPATSLYGQDAIGGVIQIFTKKGSGAPKFYAGIGYGTYNTKTAEAGVHGAIGDTSFALGVSSKDTDGFSALKTNNPNLDDDDGYRNLSFTGSASHQIVEGHELGFQFLSSEGHTKFDSRFNLFNPPATINFSDNADISQLSYAVTSKNKFLPNWQSTLRLGEGMDESVSFQSFGRSLFRTKQRQYSWQNDITLPVGTLTLAYDRLEERVNSTADFNRKSRNNDGYFAGYLANLGNHTLQLNYRSDHNSQFGNNDTGGVAYGYQFNDSWRATASYGSAFKAPSFNDLYFPDSFGFATSNPNLVPEESDNIDASLRYQEGNTTASVTVFENKIRNLIALDSNFVPFNANNVKIQGVTFAASQGWNNWQLQGSVDIQSPRDETTDNLLVRRANRHAKANLSYTLGDWRFGAETIASSKRYNDSANLQPIAGYALFNLTTDYQINADWKVQARLNNVFDKSYALAFDGNPNTSGFVYNIPGSNLFVNLRWTPK